MSAEGDLLHSIKNGSLSDLVSVLDINSDNIKQLGEAGYLVGFTAEQYRQTFPWLPIDKIYLGKNAITSALYVDMDKYICCETGIFGSMYMSLNGEKEGKDCLKRIELCHKAFEEKNFDFLLHACPVDGYRIDLLNKMIEENPEMDLLELFRSHYPMVDYGFDNMNQDRIVTMYKKASKKHRNKMSSRFGKNKMVTIYRGQGEKSQDFQNAMSWTLDINTAYFFAVRFAKHEAYIGTAEVNSDDILDYFDVRGEEEVLVNPNKITITTVRALHGYDSLLGQNLKEDFFDKAKELYAFTSQDHGANHICRMLLLNHLMAPELGLTKREKQILHMAILYHDIARTNDGVDTEHGFNSSIVFEKDEKKAKDKDIIKSIITYHCHNDEVGIEALSKMPDAEFRIKMLKILKDIDALDRVRFGIRGLNVKTLRNDVSKDFVLIANLLLKFQY